MHTTLCFESVRYIAVWFLNLMSNVCKKDGFFSLGVEKHDEVAILVTYIWKKGLKLAGGYSIGQTAREYGNLKFSKFTFRMKLFHFDSLFLSLVHVHAYHLHLSHRDIIGKVKD